MAQFRKRPIVIEAIMVSHALTDAKMNWDVLPKWFLDAYEKGYLILLSDAIEVVTLEGRMKAGWDDWLIRGVKGELYPCKRDIFLATYETVDAPTS